MNPRPPPQLSVLTPAYNRAHTLNRVYQSLCEQTAQIFEWVIVDDGSSDSTGSLVAKWQETANFDICFVRKPNGGKHTAHNTGIKHARGEILLIWDSDDAAKPDAIEVFWKAWEPLRGNQDIAGVVACCVNQSGHAVNGRREKLPLIAKPVEIRETHGITGELWGFYRTAILRNYPFPEFPGEKFVPEGLVWNRIGEKYRMLYIPNELRIYHQEGGLSSDNVKIRIQSPRATETYYTELLQIAKSQRMRIRAAGNLIRFRLHSKMYATAVGGIRANLAVKAFAAVLGVLMYGKDLFRSRKT